MQSIARSAADAKSSSRVSKTMPTDDLSEERRKARQLDGRATGTEPSHVDEIDVLAGKRPDVTLWVLALGHILFRFPPIIVAYVNHWMSWRIFNHESENAVSCEEAFNKLIFAVLNDGVDLQIKTRRVEDRMHATSTVSYEISTMYNPESHRLSDFACSESVLLTASNKLEGSEAELRLRAVISYLMRRTDEPLFPHHESSIDMNGARYCNFTENNLLEMCQDHSAHFIVIGIYIGSYIEQAVEEKEAAETQDQTERADAMLEAGRNVMGLYEDAIEQLNERCTRLSRSSWTLPDSLAVYLGHEDESNGTICGIPIEVVNGELTTFRWLKWAWHTQVQEAGKPILPLLRDLWWAKSTVLFHRYFDFFDNDSDDGINFDTHILKVASFLVPPADNQ